MIEQRCGNVRRAALVVATAAVLAGCGGPPAGPVTPSAASDPQRGSRDDKGAVLYYRNPMGLPDTSPVPKKDSMGMDYLAVYAGDAAAPGQVRVSADKLQKLGVRTEPAARRALNRTLRIAGTIQYDERRQTAVSPRFEGWITTLFVNTTGAHVRRGQPLFEAFSPDLVSAQEEYRIAVRAQESLVHGDAEARAGADSLVRSSLERLRNWDIADADLAALRHGGPARRNLLVRAPSDGVVTDKAARAGMRFMPGEVLFQIADLSSVWLVGSVFEQDIAQVRVGQRAGVTTVAYPGRTFAGAVTFIAPILQPETRTVQIRVELENAAGLLMPAMFGTIELEAGTAMPRLTVPDSSILDSGTRRLVIVDRGGGAFEPREIRTGARGDTYTEVLDGLREGEAVVINGNFLIDAESNLKAAVDGLAGRDSAPAH